MDLKAIGRRIKAAREVKGLTQEALAELVNFKPHAHGLSLLRRETDCENHPRWLPADVL